MIPRSALHRPRRCRSGPSTIPASVSITCRGSLDRVTSTVVAPPSPSPSTANVQVGVRRGGDHRDPLQVDAHAASAPHDPVDSRVTRRSTERAMADSTQLANGPGRPYSSMPVCAFVVALGQHPPGRDVGQQHVVVAGHPGAVPAVRGTEAQRVVDHRLAGQGDHELPGAEAPDADGIRAVIPQ